MNSVIGTALQDIIDTGTVAANARTILEKGDPATIAIWDLLRDAEVMGKRAASLRVPEPEPETQPAAVNEEPESDERAG